MSARGFTLIELLVAMTLLLLLASAAMQAVPAAREAFTRIPAELETQQRARVAMESIAQAARMAIARAVGDAHSLTLVIGVPGGGAGILASHAGLTAPLLLNASGCPAIKDVCGFTSGAWAVVQDAWGAFDVFAVAATTVGTRSVTPSRALSKVYAAGATVASADRYTFRLAMQADGTESLVRETAAGAVQPLVDFVGELHVVLQDDMVRVSIRVDPEPGERVPSRIYRTVVRVRATS